MSTPTTRASLLVKLQDPQDVEAWDTFVRIYSPVVFRTARKLNLQPADAENVVQEVLIVVSNSVGPWLQRDDRGRFLAWLLRIARNKSIDLLTRHATKPLIAPAELDDEYLHRLAEGESYAEIQLDREYRLALFDSAAREVQKIVSPKTWNAFWMTTIENVSIADASRTLQVRPGVIYLSRCRVMERIKRLVESWEVDRDA